MLRQGQLQQDAQGHPRQLLSVPKDNLCSAPSFTVKEVFTDVQAKPCVSVCTHCFLCHHCVPLKSLTSVFFALPCYFHTLLFSGLDSPSSLWRDTPVPPSFQWHFTGLCPAAPHLPCTGEPQTEHCTPSEHHQGRRSCTSLSLLLPGYPWWPLLQGHIAGSSSICCFLDPRGLS